MTRADRRVVRHHLILHTRTMTRRTRRIIAALLTLVVVALTVLATVPQQPAEPAPSPTNADARGPAVVALESLEVKGRAPKTGYDRDQFGDGWSYVNGCTTRHIILYRDLTEAVLDESCRVTSGVLKDPYSGNIITFTREDSDAVQIDHVVALSDAWQKGAQQLTFEQRVQLANDPLELLAVDGTLNQQKADADAASWLPPLKEYRCPFVSRQIAVKQKYHLWVTQAEKDAMLGVLAGCPNQLLPEK